VANLHHYQASPAAKTLHAIRLEIKRIKIVLKLTRTVVSDFPASGHYAPFRTIFKQAQKIRSPGIERELLLRYKIEAKPPIKKKEVTPLKDSTVFVDRIPSYVALIKEKERELTGDLRKVSKHDIRAYTRRMKKRLERQLPPAGNLTMLHHKRKTAKAILYSSEIVRKRRARLDPFFDHLQRSMGEWHDRRMLLGSLKKKGDEATLLRIKEECRTELQAIRGLCISFYR